MSLSAKPPGSNLVLASSTLVLPSTTNRVAIVLSPSVSFPFPLTGSAAAAIGADIALCSGSYTSPLTHTNGFKARGRQLFLIREFKQPFRQFVAGFEDKNDRFRGLIDLSGLHCSCSIRLGL